MDKQQIVYVVDDDEGIREGLGMLMDTINLPCQLFSNASDFLDSYDPDISGCLILDIRMPHITGLDLQVILKERRASQPIIFITGHGDVPMAVEAMRQGAFDFIRKPFREHDLLDRINEALAFDARKRDEELNLNLLLKKLGLLSIREKQVFERVAAGEMNKLIAHELNISERTVEVHRSQVMKKLDARTLAQLVRMKIVAELNEPN